MDNEIELKIDEASAFLPQAIIAEEQRIENEENRKSAEATRITNEQTRQTSEATRIANETTRIAQYNQLVEDTQDQIDEKYSDYTNAIEGLYEEIAYNSFDNVAAMKACTRLEAGATVQTLGYNSVNDGGAATYKIRNKTANDFIDNNLIISISTSLVAEKIYNENKISASITPEYILTKYIKTSDDYATSKYDIPREQEGICSTGTNKFLTFYSPDSSKVTNTNDVLIEEYDTSNRTNPTILRSKTVVGLNHANSCCFDSVNNKIYTVKWGYYENETFHGSAKIDILDYSTLEIIDTIDFGTYVTQIEKIAFYNNKLYGMHSKKLYELNTETEVATLLYQLSDSEITSSQGIEIRNNKLYIIYTDPLCIRVYNLANGNVLKTISLNYYDNFGHFYGYVADMSFINDDELYITPHYQGDRVNETSNYGCSYYINYTCKVNLNGNGNQNSFITGNRSFQRIYIDTTTPENTLYSTGSDAYPLKLISETLNNYYVAVLKYKILTNQSSDLTYYGVFRLIDNDFTLTTKNLNCYGFYGINANCNVGVLRVYNKRMYLRGSKISGSTLFLNSETEDSEFEYSTCNFFNVAITKNLNVSGSIIHNKTNKITYKATSLLSQIQATLTDSTNKKVCNFSANCSTNNFYPQSYLLCIGLTSGENIVFPRVMGLGNNRKFFDKDGNDYTVTTFDKTSKTIEITSSNASNITVVTLVTL